MQRVPWFWIALAAALLLIPGPAGRLLLDLLGGITLTLLLLPLIAGGAAWIGWQLLKRRLRTCPSCGVSSFDTSVCPACGQLFTDDAAVRSDQGWLGRSATPEDLDASDVTINVDAVDVGNRGETRD